MRAPFFTDWRLVVGSHVDRRLLPWLVAAALLALVLSALALRHDRRRGRAALILLLRAGAIAACLSVALQPSLELRQVTRVPNQIAVLVDQSRSMIVKPPDGGKPRHVRASEILRDAQPMFDRWAAEGHRVEVLGFGEALAPTSSAAAAEAPRAEATRLGEAK